MTDVDQLLKATVEELDKLLNPKNVLGDPIERDGATVIPIVSYGFGFGAGGGEGGEGAKAGTGGGAGAGGGIKPARRDHHRREWRAGGGREGRHDLGRAGRGRRRGTRHGRQGGGRGQHVQGRLRSRWPRSSGSRRPLSCW